MKNGIGHKKVQITREKLFCPENLFLLIGYVFGFLLIYSNPPFQSNDEDRHFYNAYLLSTGQITPVQNKNQVGGYLPKNLYAVSDMYQGIPFSTGAKINYKMLKELSAVPLNKEAQEFYDNSSYRINPVSYFPFIIGIKAAALINSNPIHLLWGARIAGLLTFLLIVFFAIKIIPVHKWVLFAVALSPMTIYQATSVSYDVLCLSLSFLIIALALKYAFMESKLRAGDIALYCLAVLLQSSTKSGYFLVPLFFLVVPLKNIGSVKRLMVAVTCIVAACFLPSLLWNSYLSSLHLGCGKPVINDFLYGTAEQTKVILSAPFAFVSNLFLNSIVQGKDWIIGALGRFGYAYAKMNHTVLFFHGLALIVISVLDSSKTLVFSCLQKVVTAIAAIGTIVIIIAGFLFISPVGANMIFGLQGRYFIPILPLLLLLNINQKEWVPMAEKWKAPAIALYVTVVLAYTIRFINARFY